MDILAGCAWASTDRTVLSSLSGDRGNCSFCQAAARLGKRGALYHLSLGFAVILLASTGTCRFTMATRLLVYKCPSVPRQGIQHFMTASVPSCLFLLMRVLSSVNGSFWLCVLVFVSLSFIHSSCAVCCFGRPPAGACVHFNCVHCSDIC